MRTGIQVKEDLNRWNSIDRIRTDTVRYSKYGARRCLTYTLHTENLLAQVYLKRSQSPIRITHNQWTPSIVKYSAYHNPPCTLLGTLARVQSSCLQMCLLLRSLSSKSSRIPCTCVGCCECHYCLAYMGEENFKKYTHVLCFSICNLHLW